MNKSNYIAPEESTAIAAALQKGAADRAFTLLADYLSRNNLTLSDDTLKLYLERELFACLEGRGQIIDAL